MRENTMHMKIQWRAQEQLHSPVATTLSVVHLGMQLGIVVVNDIRNLEWRTNARVHTKTRSVQTLHALVNKRQVLMDIRPLTTWSAEIIDPPSEGPAS